MCDLQKLIKEVKSSIDKTEETLANLRRIEMLLGEAAKHIENADKGLVTLVDNEHST